MAANKAMLMSFHAAINIHFLHYKQAGMHYLISNNALFSLYVAMLIIRQMSFHVVVSRHFLHYTQTGGNFVVYQQYILLTLYNNSE